MRHNLRKDIHTKPFRCIVLRLLQASERKWNAEVGVREAVESWLFIFSGSMAHACTQMEDLHIHIAMHCYEHVILVE